MYLEYAHMKIDVKKSKPTVNTYSNKCYWFIAIDKCSNPFPPQKVQRNENMPEIYQT